jgi:hypothetical protein
MRKRQGLLTNKMGLLLICKSPFSYVDLFYIFFKKAPFLSYDPSTFFLFFIFTPNGLRQGSQTQIHRGATFGWKMTPWSAVLIKKGSAGRNLEKYAIFT